MLSRSRAWVLLGCLVLLAGCKGSGDADSRPLPAPEPPPAPATADLRDGSKDAPRKRALEEQQDPPLKARRPSEEAADARPAGALGTATAGDVSAAPTAAAGAAAAPLPALPSSVPQVAAPSAACLSRCQGAMQGCLSTPVDAGVPGFGNLELCKKAFEACQNACSKQ